MATDKNSLTPIEKWTLLSIAFHNDDRLRPIPDNQFLPGIRQLERKGLVNALWLQNGSCISARLTDDGKDLLQFNPQLKDNIDWSKIPSILSL